MARRDEILKEIEEHPERHKHSYEALQRCCFINGALDIALIQAHEGLTGWNGSACDVNSGPCSCGAWH